MPRTTLKIGAGLVTAALLLGACSDDADDAAADVEHATEVSASAPAAELRAGLTALLQEHVYLAGSAIAAAVDAGGDLEAPPVAAAVGTLDANSMALADAVGGVYGDEAGALFLDLWRSHIGFFVDYTLGGVTGDAAAQDQARQDLDGYGEAFGSFIEDATGGLLPTAAVADELATHVDSLLAAVDAVLAGSPDVHPKLREAAGHMPHTAFVLADAIARQFPERFAA